MMGGAQDSRPSFYVGSRMQSKKVVSMCHAVVELTDSHDTFTMEDLHRHMHTTGAKERGNSSARLIRLVRNEVVSIANEHEVAGGGVARYRATAAIYPDMIGNLGAYQAARYCAPQPELCKVWGINMPAGIYSHHYPNARDHKQSWN